MDKFGIKRNADNDTSDEEIDWEDINLLNIDEIILDPRTHILFLMCYSRFYSKSIYSI